MSWHLEDAERILRELAGPDVTDPEADAKARKRALDILFRTRLSPSDKAAKRPGYRCTECRGAATP